MPKIQVTPELASSLRKLRIDHGVTAKDLSLAIGKSASYITMLEKNKIMTIDAALFDNVLSAIVGSPRKTKLESAYEELGENVHLIFSSTEMEQQYWLINFDETRRAIPVPEKLIDYITQLMEDHSIERDYLLSSINSNLDLIEVNYPDNIRYNEWFKDSDDSSSIIIKFDSQLFNAILDKKAKETKYIFLFAILYYLYRIINNNLVRGIKDEDANTRAKDTLNEFKVYTLLEKHSLVNSSLSVEEINNLLPKEDVLNKKLIKEINNCLNALSDANVTWANKHLEVITNNLSIDSGLFLTLSSAFDFEKIKDCSFDKRQEFLDDIRQYMNEYDFKDQHQINEYN